MALATKLTYQEFCTLVGLSFLAVETDKQLIAITRAVSKVTGEVLDQSDYGHAADFVYAPEGRNPTESVRIMLRKLGIVHETEDPDPAREARPKSEVT